jgi:hypothetical protein
MSSRSGRMSICMCTRALSVAAIMSAAASFQRRDAMPDKTLLRRAWDNMQNRVRGNVCDGCGKPRWKGLEVEWQSFHEFREWAHSHGWLPNLVLDRRDGEKGYTCANCQWITKRANDRKARNSHKPECQCFWCRRVHAMQVLEAMENGEPF